MADPGGLPINFNWGYTPSTNTPKVPTAAGLEEQQQKAAMQEAQLREAQAKAARFEAQLKAGPEMTFNPVETTVGPEGKKSYSLIKELQVQGPEKYIQGERQRLAEQQALGLSDLQGQIAQQQAQQQGRLAQYGLKGGNRALMGRYSMRDALMARQGLGRQFQTQAGELESQGQKMAMDVQQKNVGLMGQAMKDIETFNLEKWKKQKEVEAAKESAQATREASGGK